MEAAKFVPCFRVKKDHEVDYVAQNFAAFVGQNRLFETKNDRKKNRRNFSLV